MTRFQKRFITGYDQETAWKLIKLFHPDLPDTYEKKNGDIDKTKNLIKIGGNYTWVTFRFKVPNYGNIELGLSNCNNYTLWGNGITKKRMTEALEGGEVTFKMWRFTLDCKYVPSTMVDGKVLFESDSYAEAVTEILTESGYELISVNEWFADYYKD